MNAKTSWLIFFVATLLLGVAIALVNQYAPATNSGFKDAAAALAFVSGAAVAIERVIEAGWTFLGGWLGTYWPLREVRGQVDALQSELDASLAPFYDGLEKKLTEAAQADEEAQKALNSATDEIAALKKRYDDLKNLAPDNQRVQLIAAAAAQNVAYLSQKYGDVAPELQTAGAIANISINGLQNFLASFKDNPGRRLISIYAGAILGLGVTGFFGLDLFQAVLGTTPKYPHAQIVLTGIVIGLGSSPTHEVIRAVQEYKKSRKGDNLSQPALPAAVVKDRREADEKRRGKRTRRGRNARPAPDAGALTETVRRVVIEPQRQQAPHDSRNGQRGRADEKARPNNRRRHVLSVVELRFFRTMRVALRVLMREGVGLRGNRWLVIGGLLHNGWILPEKI